MNRPPGVGKSPPPILPRPGSSSNLSQLATSVAAGGVIPVKSQPVLNQCLPYPANGSSNGQHGIGGDATDGGVYQNGNGNGGEPKMIQIDGQTYQMIPMSQAPLRPPPSSPAPLRPKLQAHQQFPGTPTAPQLLGGTQQRISPKSQGSLPAATFPSTALRPQQPSPKGSIFARSAPSPTTSLRPLMPAMKAEHSLTTLSPGEQMSPDRLIASFLDPTSFSDTTMSPLGMRLEGDPYSAATLMSPAVSAPHSPVHDVEETQVKVESPSGNLDVWTTASFVVDGELGGHPSHNHAMTYEDVKSEMFMDDEEGEGGGKKKKSSVASARFRIKKKMKEQELEVTAKTMTAKVHALQRKIHLLEGEAAYLRELLRLRALNEAALDQQQSQQLQPQQDLQWSQ